MDTFPQRLRGALLLSMNTTVTFVYYPILSVSPPAGDKSDPSQQAECFGVVMFPFAENGSYTPTNQLSLTGISWKLR